ncbi:MAG: glycerol dehydrogenase [Eubacterium sp.]|nr:glycerol dehydrogenase [Eubacterium sp.]
MKEKIFQSPSRYIQGTCLIGKLPEYTKAFGSRLLLLVSAGNTGRMQKQLKQIASEPEVFVAVEVFRGECTQKEIDRIRAVCQKEQIDVIAGIGGGKVIDTAKAVSHFECLRLAVVPTTASSDAPCSALSIVYKEDGGLDKLLWLRTNPDLVLADLDLIVRAPAHLLAVGMGDALATYFEMKECYAKDADNFCGGRITLAARAIARQCYETIIEDGYQAYLSVKKQCVTGALENVVEANTLLSGIGFESGGICAAHPINNGLAELAQTHPYMHGEKVAFALLCQLILAQEPQETLREVIGLFRKIGLPVTLQELGLKNINRKELELVAKIANQDPCTHNLSRRVEEETIISAILLADETGSSFKL